MQKLILLWVALLFLLTQGQSVLYVNTTGGHDSVAITDSTKITFTATNMVVGSKNFLLSAITLITFEDTAIPDQVEKNMVGGGVASARVFPNPGNPSLTLHFGLVRSGKVNVSVLSSTGSKIRQLMDKRLSEGAYSVAWDGVSDAGQRVASGVYLMRIAMNGTVLYKKAVLIK